MFCFYDNLENLGRLAVERVYNEVRGTGWLTNPTPLSKFLW